MTYDQLSPEQEANRAEQKRIGEESVAVEQRRGAEAVKAAEAEQHRAEAEQEHAEKKQRLINDAISLGNKHIEEARSAFKDAVAKRSTMKLSELPLAPDLLAYVGLALGQLGAGARGHNDALDILQAKLKNRMDVQRANIAAADDAVVMARTGIRDAEQAKSALINDVDVNEAAVWKAIESKWRTDLAARKVPAAQIDTDARVLQAQKNAAEAEQKALAPTVRHVQDTLTNMVRGKLRTSAGGGGGGGMSDKAIGKKLENEGKIDGIVQKVIQNSGYKEQAVSNQKFNQMAATLAGAKDNAALAAAGAGQWVKQAQGGTGVISDSDMRTFWGKIGGVPDRVENFIENALSGKMGAGKQKIVADAVRELANASKREMDGITKRIDDRLSAIGLPLTEARRGTYARVYGSEGGAAPAAPNPQIAKARAWLADPKNAKDPNRAGVEARLKQLEGK